MAGLLATALLLSCRSDPKGPSVGWTPLWRPSWELLHADELWLRGVPLDEARELAVEGRQPLRFRARLLNAAKASREVVLDGPSGARRWTLAPGEDRPVGELLAPGRHRIDAAPGVILGEPRLGLPVERPRLVVVVLADTLRADHVTPQLTPGILHAFQSGRRWSDVTANSPWTLPSVASLFTSRPVFDLAFPDGDLVGVPAGVPTWTEVLEEAGFTGGAAVANFSIHAQNGFAAGFASYRVPAAGKGPRQRDVAWGVAEARRFLAAHAGEDAFFYLHTMDTHEPFRDHGQGLPPAPAMTPLGLRDRPATAEERDLIRALYRGEVRHLDQGLAPFLAELPPEATVAFVSDHGEVLGEHGVWGHGLTLYQEVVAVPLLLRGPKVEAGTVDEPVQLLDLAPTILDAAGLAPMQGMAGRSLLAPRRPGEARLPIVSATFSAGPLRWAWRDGGRKAVWRGAIQPDGVPGGRALREREPLPAGFFVHALPGDEEGTEAPATDLGRRAARVFAHSAGRMVPGVTVMIAGVDGPAAVSFDAAGELEPVQVWGGSEVEVDRNGSRWTVRTAEAAPWAGVAFRATGEVTLTPVAGSLPWPGREVGRAIDRRSEERRPPALDAPGAYAWWNDERTLEVSGQEETLERLRALGYL